MSEKPVELIEFQGSYRSADALIKQFGDKRTSAVTAEEKLDAARWFDRAIRTHHSKLDHQPAVLAALLEEADTLVRSYLETMHLEDGIENEVRHYVHNDINGLQSAIQSVKEVLYPSEAVHQAQEFLRTTATSAKSAANETDTSYHPMEVDWTGGVPRAQSPKEIAEKGPQAQRSDKPR